MTKLEIKKLIKQNLFNVQVLRNHVDTLYRQLWKKDEKKNQKLVGKCFKSRNSYSCPEADEDYWWIYGKIISIEEGTHANTDVYMDKFQDDKKGTIGFQINDLTFWPGSGDWVEISEREYVNAKAKVLSRI